MLYSAETDSFGVIDFDDAIRCWYALDVTRAIDCLEDVTDYIDEAEAEALFISGYREEFPADDELVSEIPLMRRLVRLQEYATILHALSEPVEIEPDWMTEIIAKLRTKLERIESALK